MNRREALRRTAMMTGYALSASTIAGVLNGCQPTAAGPTWEPAFLSPEQGALVAEMAECILPKTDTPGAKDVLVHEFIDLMLKDYFKEEEQQEFLAGLEAVEAASQEANGTSFVESTPEQQFALLQGMYEAAKTPSTTPGERPFFTGFKQLVLTGYFTSEEVGKNILAYDPVPGAYQGCIPLEEGMKAWSLG